MAGTKQKSRIIIGADLAGKPENPTGPAIRKDKAVNTSLVHADEDLLETITRRKPVLMAIDVPKTPSNG